MRVLLIEDNQRLCQALKARLEREGYAVDMVYDGMEGIHFAEVMPYDIIILDIMLPLKDGLEVCQTLRQRNINTAIIMLTARDRISDCVKGLDSGADDYLVKPFSMDELLARLRALLRRDAPQKNALLRLGDLTVDPANHVVERAGLRIEMSAKLFSLLEYFIRHHNQIITREMVENHIWNYDNITTSNAVDVYIRRLRRHIDDPFEVKLVETIRGVGYRLRVPQ